VTLLQTFDKAVRMETGWYEPGSACGLGFPLWTGGTMASLKSLGTTLRESNLLTGWAMGQARVSMPFFYTLTGTLSTPRASVGFNPLTILVILEAEADLNSKGLDLGGQFEARAGGAPAIDSRILSTFCT
jgi:hypothetical protein